MTSEEEHTAAMNYLLQLGKEGLKTHIKDEANLVTIDVTKGAMQQWHATGETFAKAVTNLRLMRGD